MLRKKILSFLTKDLAHSSNAVDLNNRKKVIEYFKCSRGQCWGEAALWAYGKRLDDEPNDDLKLRDDGDFFYYIRNLLINWDEKTTFTKEEQQDIHRFISNIMTFQRADFDLSLQNQKEVSTISEEPEETIHSEAQTGAVIPLLNLYTYDQSDLHLLLEDTKRGYLQSVVSYNLVPVTKNMLISRLEKIIQPQMIIMLSARSDDEGHAVAVYRSKKNVLYFYDSNLEEEKCLNNLHELAKLFWQRTDPSLFRGGWGSPRLTDYAFRTIHVNIFKFVNDPTYNYPSIAEFKIQAGELVEFFENSIMINYPKVPECLNLIGSLDHFQLLQLLQSSIKNEIKRVLIFACVFNRDRPLLILRYINKYCQQYIQELESKGYLKAEDIAKFAKDVNDTPYIDQGLGEVAQNQIKNWLKMYELNLINESDKASLTLMNVLCLLEQRPGDMKLAKDLLDHCEHLSHEYFNSCLLDGIMIANEKINNIETALFIWKEVGEVFGKLPSLILYNDKRIVDFMMAHFGRYYSPHRYKGQSSSSASENAIDKDLWFEREIDRTGNLPQRKVKVNRLGRVIHEEDESPKTFTSRLEYSVVKGDADQVRYCIIRGANVNAIFYERSILSLAICKHDNATIIELLLNAGANPNIGSCYDNTPLEAAITYRRGISVLRALIKGGADLNQNVYLCGSLLNWAIFNKHVEGIQALIEAGVKGLGSKLKDIRRYDSYEDLPVAKLIVTHAPDLDSLTIKDEALLFFLIDWNNIELLRIALHRGASVNIKNLTGVTLLSYGVSHGNTDIVSLLIQVGADINAKDTDGGIPLFQAVLQGDSYMVSLLIQAGADVNTKDSSGNTALHYAASHADKDTIFLLVQAGADVNVKDANKNTALHKLADNYHITLETLKILATPSNMFVKNNDGHTGLELIQHSFWSRSSLDSKEIKSYCEEVGQSYQRQIDTALNALDATVAEIEEETLNVIDMIETIYLSEKIKFCRELESFCMIRDDLLSDAVKQFKSKYKDIENDEIAEAFISWLQCTLKISTTNNTSTLARLSKFANPKKFGVNNNSPTYTFISKLNAKELNDEYWREKSDVISSCYGRQDSTRIKLQKKLASINQRI